MAQSSREASLSWLRPSFGRVTLLVWLAWLISVLLMWGMHRQRVMHPHFLPLTSLLAIQAGGAVAVVLAGLWKVIRGPRRASVLGWLLLGAAPAWLWAAHISYGVWVLREPRTAPHIDTPPLVKLGAPAAAAILDGFNRYLYPHRIEGRRVVMVYDKLSDPKGDLEAMDSHVEQMEDLLGRRCMTKVHWIRGGVLNVGARYVRGLAFGGITECGADVTTIDRHEVAHFVLHHHCVPDAEPPGVLVEGWAETQSGYEPGSLPRTAWQLKENGGALSLRELTSREWYYSRKAHVYRQGGALVDFILREYGPARFLELYTTCRPDRFAADCRRVLGIGMDELDRRFWADLERQAAANHYWRNPFENIQLGDGVDELAWNEFILQYLSGQRELERPYRQARMEIESTFRTISPNGTTTESVERLVISHDGSRHRWFQEKGGRESVVVANPRGSFRLGRRSGEHKWTRESIGHPEASKLAYYSCRRRFQSIESNVRQPSAMLSRRYACGPDATITSLEPFVENGQSYLRIGCRGSWKRPESEYSIHSDLLFRTDGHYLLQSASSASTSKDGKPESESRLEIEYDLSREGVPFARRIREQFDMLDDSYEHIKVTKRCEFTPIPEEEFTLSAFGLASLDGFERLEKIAAPRYVIVTWSGAAFFLVIGLAIQGRRLLPAQRRRATQG